MLDHLNTVPLAQRAREAILDAIVHHRFEADRLPAEDELARMLNISRTTIRTALHSLEQDGIVTRRRAIGTTVNRHVGPATLALQRLIAFDWLLEEKGYEARMEVSWHRARRPPAELAAIFGLEPDEHCYTREARFFADDQLAIYGRDVVPAANVRGDIPEDAPAVLFEFSYAHMNAPIDHAVVEIVPLVKRAGVSKLKQATGTPFVRLHERHYSHAGDAIAFSVIDIDDSFIRFEVFRHK